MGPLESGTPEDDINDREHELHETAVRFAEQMENQFDIALDFSAQSLTRLDGMLAQMVDLSEAYRSERTEEILPVALAITAYVGEVFRLSFKDASWVTEVEEGEIPPPHIRLSGGMRINLMKKSLQILTRDDSPSFAPYFQTVQGLAESRDKDTDTDA